MLRAFQVIWVALLLTALQALETSADETAQPKHVLVLYSHRQTMPINLQWDRGVREGIEANFPEPVTIDVEYLDFERIKDIEDREYWIRLLQRKYADSLPDVVIPVNDTAAECVVLNYPDLFPQAAIVLCSVSAEMQKRLPDVSRMTGVAYRLDFHGTLELARRLFPETRRVIVVSGKAKVDVEVKQAAETAFARERQLEFVYWNGLPVTELCEQASQETPGTVFLYLSQIRDRDGRATVTSHDVAERFCEVAQVPVFGLYDTLLGTGIVGGNLAPVEEQGRQAGTIAARVMLGERPDQIPFSGMEMTRPMFDWRQLRRWGISEEDLPEGSLVLHREPRAWDRYGPFMALGALAFGLQSLLIAALLANRRKRRVAEVHLADQLQFANLLSDVSSRFVELQPERVPGEIEKALTCIVQELELDRGMVFLLSDEGGQLQLRMSSVRSGELEPPSEISPDSVPWMWARLKRGEVFHFSSVSDLPAEAVQEGDFVRRLGLKSGAAFALQDNGRIFGILTFGQLTHARTWDEPVLQRLKLFSEVIAGSLAHARADTALSTSRGEARRLAGQLLTAQEDERRRLAREIHDDVSQRLAAATIQLGTLEQQLTESDPTRAALGTIRDHLSTLSRDVHRISRQLHPAILDDLGLADAIRSECDRFGSQSHLTVHFRCGQLPPSLPKDVAICLYRVAQEALWNVAKHAQTDRVDLVLSADAESVRLEAGDHGCGFDVSNARSRPGLGLASMRERVRLIGGTIQIQSGANSGTSILVSIPLTEDLV